MEDFGGVGDAGADGVSNGDASNARRTFETIRAALTSEEGGFDLVEQSDMPFLIKEHDRKYQWGCGHATVWRRRRREKRLRRWRRWWLRHKVRRQRPRREEVLKTEALPQ